MTISLDCVFVELAAPDAPTAVTRVSSALAAVNQPAPHTCTLAATLPDPLSGRWGIELTFPERSRVANPTDAWLLAHALASQLGGDARVEPCFDTSPIEPLTESMFDNVVAPRDVEWHLVTMRVAEAQAMVRAAGHEPGQDVRIGHPDTGFTRHPEIWSADASPVESGVNYLEPDPSEDPRDTGLLLQPGHGTKTASIMVARPAVTVPRTDDDEPVDLRGIAPAAQVRAYRVTRSVVILGWGRRLARAIEQAVADGCHVISLSLGGLGDARLDRAIRHAEANGVVVVAAAGNYVPWVVAPASHPLVIACAASDVNDAPWGGSASGPLVDITAPGAGVWIAGWDGDRAVAEPSSGTSYATAAVASACALWRSFHAARLAEIHPSQHPALFRAALRASARPVAGLSRQRFGAGVLDCRALLTVPLRAEITEMLPSDPLAGATVPALAALLGPAGATRRSSIERLTIGEQAELAFLLATDARARTGWRDPACHDLPIPAAASRRLSLALRPRPSEAPTRASSLATRVSTPATTSRDTTSIATTISLELELPIELSIELPIDLHTKGPAR